MLLKADFPVFGNSNVKMENQPTIGSMEKMPFIELVSHKFNYWPQTGQPFTFRLNTTVSATDTKAMVLENGRLSVLNPDEKHIFSYVPGHDKQLRNESAGAARQDIVMAHIAKGNEIYRVSYTVFFTSIQNRIS